MPILPHTLTERRGSRVNIVNQNVGFAQIVVFWANVENRKFVWIVKIIQIFIPTTTIAITAEDP